MWLMMLGLAWGAEGPTVYATVGGQALTLDVWEPAGAGPHPGVMLIHGGGWKYGDLYEGLREQAEAAAAAGLVVVSPNYRRSTEAVWPAQREDVACALRWMKGHADSLGLDPGRIAAVGHSAGGQLALTLGEAPELEPPAWCEAHADGALAAVVSLAGPADMEVFYQETLWWGRKMARELLGLSPLVSERAAAEATRAASPKRWVGPDGPAVLQVVGGEDQLVPGAVAASFDATLRAAGRSSEVRTVPEAGHNDVNRVELWLPWVLERLAAG